MSHDPSHWEAEVLNKYKDVDLMLAGHTHGMQFGLEIPVLNGALCNTCINSGQVCMRQKNRNLYVNQWLWVYWLSGQGRDHAGDYGS